jgi:hypothetical protein
MAQKPLPGRELASEAVARLPEGHNGIAGRYPGDKGIERDPNVIFVENFDSKSLEVIFKRWEDVKDKRIMSLSPDVPDDHAKGRSLLLTYCGR